MGIIEIDMDNLSKLSEEEQNTFIALLSKATKKNQPWKPSYGEKFFVVRENGVVQEYVYDENDGGCIEFYIKMNNCFKTEEEAQFALEKHLVMVELGRFAKENNTESGDNFEMIYNRSIDKLVAMRSNVCITIGAVAFSSEELVYAAIEKVGEDRIKKYLFNK